MDVKAKRVVLSYFLTSIKTKSRNTDEELENEIRSLRNSIADELDQEQLLYSAAISSMITAVTFTLRNMWLLNQSPKSDCILANI